LKKCESVFLPVGGMLFAFMPIETLGSLEKKKIRGKVKGVFQC